METTKHENKPNNFNWVKSVYFYLILACTIFTIALSSTVLIYTSTIRFILTDLQNKPYISYESCKNGANYYESGPLPEMDSSDKTREQKLSSEEQKTCSDKQLNIEYQQTLLSTSLAILVAGIILTIHLVIFKKKK